MSRPVTQKMPMHTHVTIIKIFYLLFIPYSPGIFFKCCIISRFSSERWKKCVQYHCITAQNQCTSCIEFSIKFMSATKFMLHYDKTGQCLEEKKKIKMTFISENWRQVNTYMYIWFINTYDKQVINTEAAETTVILPLVVPWSTWVSGLF